MMICKIPPSTPLCGQGTSADPRSGPYQVESRERPLTGGGESHQVCVCVCVCVCVGKEWTNGREYGMEWNGMNGMASGVRPGMAPRWIGVKFQTRLQPGTQLSWIAAKDAG